MNRLPEHQQGCWNCQSASLKCCWLAAVKTVLLLMIICIWYIAETANKSTWYNAKCQVSLQGTTGDTRTCCWRLKGLLELTLRSAFKGLILVLRPAAIGRSSDNDIARLPVWRWNWAALPHTTGNFACTSGYRYASGPPTYPICCKVFVSGVQCTPHRCGFRSPNLMILIVGFARRDRQLKWTIRDEAHSGPMLIRQTEGCVSVAAVHMRRKSGGAEMWLREKRVL